MIQFSTFLKGKERLEAVLKTMQSNLNFDVKPDKDDMVAITLPCSLFEDQECRDGGLNNKLEQRNYTVKIPKKAVDVYNAACYKALMTHPDIKDGIKV